MFNEKKNHSCMILRVFFCINIECHLNASFISVVCRVGFGLAHFPLCGDGSLEVLCLVKAVLKKFCQVLFFTLILFKEDMFTFHSC